MDLDNLIAGASRDHFGPGNCVGYSDDLWHYLLHESS